MWFLIRGTFWFSLVLVTLPIFDQQASTNLEQEKGVQLTDALGAAAGALSYMSSMCSEKPDVCVKGFETFSALGVRAREGARVAYGYLDTQFADDNKPAAPDEVADAVLTGGIMPASADLQHIPVPMPRPKHF